jgi:RNA polymerase sigma factor (sigma-70 family)
MTNSRDMSSQLQDDVLVGDDESPLSGRAVSRDNIVLRLAPAIAASLRRVVGGDDPEYEDMYQTALERVFRTLGESNFRGDCTTAGWAYVIARNVAVDALRARVRERTFLSLDQALDETFPQPGGDVGPERLAEARQQLSRLGDALAGMRPANAVVVYMHDVVGHDLLEISRLLRISTAAAQSRLVRGRRDVVGALDWRKDHDSRAKMGKMGSPLRVNSGEMERDLSLREMPVFE